MNDDAGGWKKFDKLKLDKKALRKRLRTVEGATQRHFRDNIASRVQNIRGVQKKIIIWLLLVGGLIVSVVAQVVLASPNYMADAPAPGGTYAEAVRGPLSNLNPLYASSSAEAAASELLFSGLYGYDTSGHLSPDVAEKYTSDAEGKVYEVTLRKNVYWHDDTKLDADDVVFTINLIKNPQTRAEALRPNWRDVEVKKLDDHKVQFVLPTSYAAFPYALTFPILPKHLLESIQPATLRENPFSLSPVGSGPFKFRLSQSADVAQNHAVLHMVANERYHFGRAKLNRFELHAYATQDDIVRAVRIGEVSGAADLSVADTQQIKNDNYHIITKPINSGMYLLFNMNHPSLQDLKLRQALRVGTNAQSVRNKLGAHIPGLDSPFINGQITGNDVPKAPTYDRNQANALLDEAGWTRVGNGIRQKDGKKLAITVTATKDSQTDQVLEVVVRDWSALGIEVRTNIIDASQPNSDFYQSVIQPRNYEVLLYELLIGADPDVFPYWHSSQMRSTGFNLSNFLDKGADASLLSARIRSEPELRNAKYKTFIRQWMDAVPAVGLYQQVSNYAIYNTMNSIDFDQKLVSSIDRYSNILYWTVNSETAYYTP